MRVCVHVHARNKIAHVEPAITAGQSSFWEALNFKIYTYTVLQSTIYSHIGGRELLVTFDSLIAASSELQKAV